MIPDIFFLIYFYLFIYFWPGWVCMAVRGFSRVAVHGLLLAVVSLLQHTGSRACGFQ